MNGKTSSSSLPHAVLNPVGLQRKIRLTPQQLIDPITSQSNLFTIAHYGIAEVDLSSWRLMICGLVKKPCELSFDEIRQLPKTSVQSFHQCAGFPRNPDIPTRRIANVVWSGVNLAELLHSVGVDPTAKFLWSYGLDSGSFDGIRGGNYQKDMPLERLTKGGVLLAYEINGQPLTAEHGFPIRLVVPGYYGTNSVKWLCRLELAAKRAESIFTTTFYNDPVSDSPTSGTYPLWEAPPESAIVFPAAGAHLPRDGFEIRGWAWAANGIAQVDISVDGGSSWTPAFLEDRSQWSWQRFSFFCKPKKFGSIEIIARATDVTGTTQRSTRARNAMHRVQVEIST